MKDKTTLSALIFGAFLLLGLAALGYLPGHAALKYKATERTVTVKGLSERIYPADKVIWPIVFTDANNDLDLLYQAIENKTQRIQQFLLSNGVSEEEISIAAPSVTDKSLHWYQKKEDLPIRYTADQKISVYTGNVDLARKLMSKIIELGHFGIAISGDHYARPSYLFTKLNDVKPNMIEEATKKAREVAVKFAEDSDSKLGKIKHAQQGNFSIGERDAFNRHLKVVRVVSTVEYYLSD